MGGKTACIGVGNVGRAWAVVFARAGHDVALYDADSDAVTGRALPMMRRHAEDLEAAGLIASAADVMAHISAAPSLKAAVDGTVHVQESVKEDAAVKREVSAAIDAAAPADAVVASSTSALPGSTFYEDVPGRARCLVAHPVNPPSLVPLVELCATPWTDPDITARCRDFMTSLGQHPIIVKKELAGFILNRLQYTLFGEALHLIGEGYCTADDIDAVLKHGLALRWAFIGPLEVAHLNADGGFRDFAKLFGPAMHGLGKAARPDYPWDDTLVGAIHETLAERVGEDQIADRQAWRDRRLMDLAVYLRDAAKRLG